METKQTERIALWVLTALLLAGCSEQPDVQHYKVAKPPAEKLPVVWELPEGWQRLPVKQGLVPAYARFQVGDGELNIHRFADVGPQMTEAVPNVQRWRKNDLGLGPITKEEEFDKVVSKFDMNGTEATYIDMVGPGVPGQNTKGSLRLLGVILPVDNGAWTFKLVGPEDEMAKRKEEFDRFLKSVRMEN